MRTPDVDRAIAYARSVRESMKTLRGMSLPIDRTAERLESDINILVDYIESLEKKNEELKGFVNIKTADGVQWIGQPVWTTTCNGEVISNELTGEFRFMYFRSKERKEWMASFPYGYGIGSPVELCYSTKEAALKAYEIERAGE
jgi:hypothetical protein